MKKLLLVGVLSALAIVFACSKKENANPTPSGTTASTTSTTTSTTAGTTSTTTSTTSGTTTSGKAMSYASDVVPVLHHNAKTYHANGNGVELDTYACLSVYTSPHDSTSILASAVTWKYMKGTYAMPYGMAQMDSASIAPIVKWIIQGAKNN